MSRRPPRRALGAGVAAAGLAGLLAWVVWVAPVAAAPADVVPLAPEAPAAARVAVSFVMESGCGSSPTIEVAIQLPTGSFAVEPLPPTSWTAQLITDGTVVAFQGGPLAADTPEIFSFWLVTPNLPGVTVLFPTVQTCSDGRISWTDADPAAERPAPRMRLTENPDPILPTTTALPPTTSVPASTTVTLAPGAGISVSGPRPPLGQTDGASNVPLVAAGVVVVLSVAYVVRQRRSERLDPDDLDL